jgi:hypothetical protein
LSNKHEKEHSRWLGSHQKLKHMFSTIVRIYSPRVTNFYLFISISFLVPRPCLIFVIYHFNHYKNYISTNFTLINPFPLRSKKPSKKGSETILLLHLLYISLLQQRKKARNPLSFHHRLINLMALVEESVSVTAMTKKMRNLSSWIEVAPALLISPTKAPTSPVLETIPEEEEAEE